MVCATRVCVYVCVHGVFSQGGTVGELSHAREVRVVHHHFGGARLNVIGSIRAAVRQLCAVHGSAAHVRVFGLQLHCPRAQYTFHVPNDVSTPGDPSRVHLREQRLVRRLEEQLVHLRVDSERGGAVPGLTLCAARVPPGCARHATTAAATAADVHTRRGAPCAP
jgi:hypothetical protein